MPITRCIRHAASVVLVMHALPLTAQGRLHVAANATGSGSGTTWADAMPSLQSALQHAAPGTEIWVAAGTYRPGLPGDRAATFALRSGIAIYGGFAGTESARWQRDPATRPTVLSGDLDSNDPPVSGATWYTATATWTGNSMQIVTASGVDATAVLDGFTIAHGYGAQGAGLHADNAVATIIACRFEHNYGTWRGAAHVDGGSPTFRDCTFVENLAFAGHGGGLHLAGASAVQVQGCRFERNTAMENGGPNVAGGGLYVDFTAQGTRVEACTFVANRSIFRFALPASIYPMLGGGMFNGGTGTRIERCRFLGNVTQEGGGLASFRPLQVLHCEFAGNQAFSSTNAGGWGGGLAIIEYGAATTTSVVEGCTVLANHADDEGGGLLFAGPVNCRPSNCILRDNTDADGAVNRSQCRGQRPRWSDISGFLLAPPGEDPIDPADFPGCFDQPAAFLDADGPDGIIGTIDDDLGLAAGSPCVDRGDPAVITTGLDAGQRPRWLDGNLDGTLRLDCGAHEFGNVDLRVTVTPLGPASATVAFSLTGTAGNLVLLALGGCGPELPLATFGPVFLDLASPPVVLTFATLPATHAVTAPRTGIRLCAQALLLTPTMTGNVSAARTTDS